MVGTVPYEGGPGLYKKAKEEPVGETASSIPPWFLLSSALASLSGGL